MLRVRGKICGICRPEDARQAVQLGVDAIGLILHADSPRLINHEQAKIIRQQVPAFVSLVGVFVDADPEQIHTAVQQIGLDLIQLHGDESADYARALGLPYIKAIRAKTASQVLTVANQYEGARALLIDPYVQGRHGGTGKTLNFDLWPSSVAIHRPVILAGGLSAENLTQAITQTQPFAVDLNSGVESAPGIKSATKMAAAMGKLQGFNQSLGKELAE